VLRVKRRAGEIQRKVDEIQIWNLQHKNPILEKVGCIMIRRGIEILHIEPPYELELKPEVFPFLTKVRAVPQVTFLKFSRGIKANIYRDPNLGYEIVCSEWL